MSFIKNMDIVQPALITKAKYDFSVIEKRIMYRIIVMMQKYIRGEKLDKNYQFNVNLFNDWDIVLPTRAFLKHNEDKNYNRIRKNLLSLNDKVIEVKTDNSWHAFNIIERPGVLGVKDIKDNNAYVSFRLSPQIVNALFNFAKSGFTKFELEVAFNLTSEYSMRFYEMVSEQRKMAFLDYKIQSLKEYFKISDKYIDKRTGRTNVADLRLKVIEPSKVELDSCSPWTFDYQFLDKNKQPIAERNRRTRKVFVRIFPKFQEEYRDKDLERGTKINTNNEYPISNSFYMWIRTAIGMSNKEIENNRKLISTAEVQMPDLEGFLVSQFEYLLEAENKAGYFITMLKNRFDER